MPSPLAIAAIILSVVAPASGGSGSLDVRRFDRLMEQAALLRSPQQRHADLAIPFIREAVQSAEAAHDERREAKAQVELGAALISMHDYEGARTALLRSLELSRRDGDFATGNAALVSLGVMYDELGDYDEAVATFQRMLDLATSRGDAATRVRSLNGLAAFGNRSGRGAEGVRYSRMALRELDDGVRKGVTFPPTVFFAVPYNVGKGLSLEGEYLEASRYFDRARAAAEKQGMMSGVWHVLHETGEMDLAEGDFPTAERYFERALDIAQKIESRDPEARTRRALGSLAEQRGDLAGALAHYTTALQMYERANYQSEIPASLAALSRVQFLSGHKSDAAITLRRAETLATLINLPLALVQVKLEAGNQKLNAGDMAG
ncbi:MAG: tetratricopeptide repeat protein, partial [Acidobacteriota bacterium]